MSKVLVTEDYLEDIGDAIRSKNGSIATYRPEDMADAIEAIDGYPEPTGTQNITQNGLVSVKDKEFANVNVPNSFVAADEGKVVSNGALVAQGSQTITVNGTYDTTLNDEVTVNVSGGVTPTGNINITDTQVTDVAAYATAQVVDSDLVAGNIKKDVNILGVVGTYEGSGGGSSYPWMDATYDGSLVGYEPTVTHMGTEGQSFVPSSTSIGQAVSSGFSGNIYDLESGTKTLSSVTKTISQAQAILSVTDFVKLWEIDAVAKEYAGYIYGTSKITDLGLVLLGDFSQGGSASGNALDDSIENYSGIILQGIYSKNRTSSYNTSILYQDIVLSQQYWAGMKDRNTSYRCRVTFTDDTHVSLDGNKQVIIYGIL